MALEMLVGLNVVDDEVYQSYRDEMTPILKSYGGGFTHVQSPLFNLIL